MRTSVCFVAIFFLCSTVTGYSRQLKDGFDKEEYRHLMHISAHTTADTGYAKNFPIPQGYQLLYRSAAIGLDNLWELWRYQDIAIISIRGTTRNKTSWLANFYSAMVPAKGKLQVSKDRTFTYTLSNDPKAAVHVGWLLSTAFLSEEMLPRIQNLYNEGVRDVLIMGHSQGGAISYLLTAYFYHLKAEGKLPADLQMKTYSSASPKPGNLFFAYEYESITRGGWAFSVVNAADWVPETPVSVQTLKDFNVVNPFVIAPGLIRKQKFPNNLFFSYMYHRLNNPIARAQRNYERYLGRLLSKTVRKELKEFVPPQYVHSNHFVRTGATIVFQPDQDYYREFPDDPKQVFVHHFHKPYLYLLDRY